MKQSTFKRLYESALKIAEEDDHGHDGYEIVLVPIVLFKYKGKVGRLTGVENQIIIEEENK